METYKGLRVGIDAHCWLHRGGYSCSKELAEGITTTKYIQFCLGMIKMLRKNGVVNMIGTAFSVLLLPLLPHHHSTTLKITGTNKTLLAKSCVDQDRIQ